MAMQLAEKDFLRIFLSRMLLQELSFKRLDWQNSVTIEHDLTLFSNHKEPFSASEFRPTSRRYKLITAVEEIFFQLNISSFTYSLPETDCCSHDFYEKEIEGLVNSLVNLL